MQVFYIDLAGVTTQEGLQDVLQRELPLPAYYGRNLDALHDVLTEYGPGWDIIFYHTAQLAGARPGYFASLQRLCTDAAAESADASGCAQLQIRFYP